MTKVHYFENEHQLWIAHTPALHFGKAGSSKLISTGQQYLEIYDNEQEWATRVIELGGQLLWIAHDPELHFGKGGDSKLISTGQQHLEIYDDEQEWATRIIELGGELYPSEDEDDDTYI